MDSLKRKEIIEKWAGGLSLGQKIVTLFEKVRDIPYGDIGSRSPEDVYTNNKGTCSGKHELLKELYQELGIEIKDFIATHRFKDLPVTYPENLKVILERSDILDPHNFFKIKIAGKWFTIDATWDKPLKKLGFPVNEKWDGKSDMKVCVIPLEILETSDPIQLKKERIAQLPLSVQEDRRLFLHELTKWVEAARFWN